MEMSITAISEQSRTRLRSSLGRKNKTAWPEPELSIGTWYRKMRMSDCWEATGPARDQYGPFSEDIKRILDERIEFLNEGEPVPKTVTFSPYMTGWRKANAKPTIMFCCERPLPRRRAKDLIKSSGVLNKYPGWILGDSSFPPEFDEPLTRLALEDLKVQASTSSQAVMPQKVLYRPSERAYGIEIFIQGYGNAGVTRRATVGGIIRSQGRYYGLTVAHAFSEAESTPELSRKVDFEFSLDSSDEEELSSSEMLADETSRGSQSPPSPSTRIASSIVSRHSEVDLTNISANKHGSISLPVSLLTHRGDESIMNERGSEAQQTAEESLAVFGDLSISAETSGSASLDWALISIRDTESQVFKNLDKNGPGPRFLGPERVAERVPTATAVIALTASGKMLSGSLFGTPSYIHIPQTKNFQEVWTVDLKGKLKNGDCGTWVMDAQAGTIYGHIISGTIGSGATYIVPAHYIFDDIRLHLSNFEIYIGVELTFLSKPLLDSNLVSIELLIKSQKEVAKLKQEISDRERESNRKIEALESTLRDLSKAHGSLMYEHTQDINKIEKSSLEDSPQGYKATVTSLPAPLKGLATFTFGNVVLPFRYMPCVGNIENGRELVFSDVGGKQLTHRIKTFGGRRGCYSYATYSGAGRAFVTFPDVPAERHEIIHGGLLTQQGTPKYFFDKPSDRKRFQEEVAGQELVDEFDCDYISSRVNVQAREQLLQVWKSAFDGSLSISYYASEVLRPNILELSITVFEELEMLSDWEVVLKIKKSKKIRGVTASSTLNQILRDSSIERPYLIENLLRINELEQMTYFEIRFSTNEENERFISLWNGLGIQITKPLPKEIKSELEQGLSDSELVPSASSYHQAMPNRMSISHYINPVSFPTNSYYTAPTTTGYSSYYGAPSFGTTTSYSHTTSALPSASRSVSPTHESFSTVPESRRPLWKEKFADRR